MIQLTHHAKEQISARAEGDVYNWLGKHVKHVSNLISEWEVLSACESKAAEISAHSREVRVIVKRLRAVVTAPDGSNGDLIVACIDPIGACVKTVMLQRNSQAKRKSQDVPYL